MSKQYIAVKYNDKERAKALGARWDMAKRQWYIPAGIDITKFLDYLDVDISPAVQAVLKSRA